MATRYYCPYCQDNRTQFLFIKKLGQEVRLNPDNGKISWAADEWEEILDNGSPYLEVRCSFCGKLAKPLGKKKAREFAL